MTKRVVLLSNHSLLASGVRQLLQEEDGLELSMVTAAGQEALPMLKNLAPDVIVLDTGDASLGEGIITQLLAEHPKARVIALNVDRVGIDVYRLQRVLQTSLAGLLKAIQGRVAPTGQRDVSQREGTRRSENRDGTMGP